MGEGPATLVTDLRVVPPETIRALTATGAHPAMDVRTGPAQVVSPAAFALQIAMAPTQVMAAEKEAETRVIGRATGSPIAAATVGATLKEGVANVAGGAVARPNTP